MEGPSKRARTDFGAGSSTIKVIGKPRYVPINEPLLVLPPIPKSLYDELISIDDNLDSHTGSTTEPESSEDERDIRKNV